LLNSLCEYEAISREWLKINVCGEFVLPHVNLLNKKTTDDDSELLLIYSSTSQMMMSTLTKAQ